MKKVPYPYRGNVVTFFPTDIDPETDDGRAKAFIHGTFDCLSCVRMLSESNAAGAYILAFHALELALKAFLAQQGLSNKELRNKPYGHDLVALYREASQRGLTLPDANAAALIEYVNQFHDKGAPIRYDFTKRYELPVAATLVPIVGAVIERIGTTQHISSEPKANPA